MSGLHESRVGKNGSLHIVKYNPGFTDRLWYTLLSGSIFVDLELKSYQANLKVSSLVAGYRDGCRLWLVQIQTAGEVVTSNDITALLLCHNI